MNPLTNIPARVRTALYWTGYVVGILGQGLTIVWGAVAASSPDISMPLWLVIASAVLGLAQTQLNLLAGVNVPAAEGRHRGELGAVDVGTAVLSVVLVLLVIVVLFGVPAGRG